jgi:hypothetical protein
MKVSIIYDPEISEGICLFSKNKQLQDLVDISDNSIIFIEQSFVFKKEQNKSIFTHSPSKTSLYYNLCLDSLKDENPNIQIHFVDIRSFVADYDYKNLFKAWIQNDKMYIDLLKQEIYDTDIDEYILKLLDILKISKQLKSSVKKNRIVQYFIPILVDILENLEKHQDIVLFMNNLMYMYILSRMTKKQNIKKNVVIYLGDEHQLNFDKALKTIMK